MINIKTDGENIYYSFSGNNFMEIKDVLKENGCTYAKSNHLWKLKNLRFFNRIKKELEVYDKQIFIEPKVIKVVEKGIEPETEYFHINYNRQLLNADPLGQFQIDAIQKGVSQSRLALFLKQGLGKTFVSIAILNHLFYKKLVEGVLICCRAEGVYNFKNELLRFNTFNLKEKDIYIVDIENRKPFYSKCKIVICKYSSFRMICKSSKSNKKNSDSLNIEKWYPGKRCLILDESHSCKNPQAIITKDLLKYAEYFRFRYLLTGTPYPKGIEELWSQFQIMDKRIIGLNYQSFLGEIAKLGTKFSQYGISYYKENNIRNFIEYIKPWTIRVSEEEANIKLPKFIENNIMIHMNDDQYEIYKQFLSYRIQDIVDKNLNHKSLLKEIYSDFPRIQLAITDPTILQESLNEKSNPLLRKLVDKFKFENLSRLEVCNSLIENEIENGRRVLIWSGHPKTIKSLQEHYKRYKPLAIYGDMDKDLKEKGVKRKTNAEIINDIISEFKKNDSHKLLIASYLMVGTSANIKEVQSVIYWDRPWNYSVFNQSLFRNRRVDSEFNETYCYYLIAERTIEEKLDRVLQQRDSLDKELLNIDKLSTSDLIKIFSGEKLDVEDRRYNLLEKTRESVFSNAI